MQVVFLEIPTPVSRTTNWTSSIKFSVNNFMCVQGYSFNLCWKGFLELKLSWAEIGRTMICCIFYLWSNSFSVKVLAGFPLSSCHKIVLNFQKVIQKFTLGFVLRSPDDSIMPIIAEINGGIDICGEPLEAESKTLFSFFLIICQNWSKVCNWAKKMTVADTGPSCFFTLLLYFNRATLNVRDKLRGFRRKMPEKPNFVLVVQANYSFLKQPSCMKQASFILQAR